MHTSSITHLSQAITIVTVHNKCWTTQYWDTQWLDTNTALRTQLLEFQDNCLAPCWMRSWNWSIFVQSKSSSNKKQCCVFWSRKMLNGHAGFQANLGDVEILCEVLAYGLHVVSWLDDGINIPTCPHTANDAVVLLEFEAAGARANVLGITTRGQVCCVFWSHIMKSFASCWRVNLSIISAEPYDSVPKFLSYHLRGQRFNIRCTKL